MNKYIFHNIKHLPPLYIFCFSLAMVAALGSIGLPILSSQIVEQIINKNYEKLVFSSINIAICLGVLIPFYVIKSNSNVKCLKVLTTKTQGLLLKNLARRNDLSLVDFKYLQTMISQSIPKFASEVITFIQTLLTCIILIGLGTVYAIKTNIAVLILTLAITGLIFIINNKNLKKLQTDSNGYESAQNNLNKKIWDHINNHEISTFLQEEKTLQGYDEKNKEFVDYLFSLKKSSNGINLFASFGTVSLICAITVAGGFMNYYGLIEYAQVYAFVLIMPNVSTSLFNLPKVKSSYNVLIGLWNTMNGYLAPPVQIGEESFDEKITHISINNLSYSYPDAEKEVLKDISLEISSGDFLGIYGESGCGKSTLIKLIAGLLPSKNKVIINSTPLNKIIKTDFFNRASYLKQSAFLTPTSIKQNITMGNTSIYTMEQMLEMADLQTLVSKLPQGIDSDTKSLSSGERQKICLARAFWQNRDILILDEATSAIDEESRAKILQSLRNLAQTGKIIVAISHDDSFLESCNRRLCLTANVSIEEGV